MSVDPVLKVPGAKKKRPNPRKLLTEVVNQSSPRPESQKDERKASHKSNQSVQAIVKLEHRLTHKPVKKEKNG